jgi:hypothetical protein
MMDEHEGPGLTEFLDDRLEYRRLFSEFWGTFLLVLVAAGAGAVGAQPYGGGLILPVKVIAPGVMVMAIIYFMGTVSGCDVGLRVATQLPVAPRAGLHCGAGDRGVPGVPVPAVDDRRDQARRDGAGSRCVGLGGGRDRGCADARPGQRDPGDFVGGQEPTWSDQWSARPSRSGSSTS